ncbi:MAG TPA: FkbM family methyltransferase [Thermoanaerobaculia bacterium]|nr:FkbM family methyltransferase [Thermoanaerobaculia bacterium]
MRRRALFDEWNRGAGTDAIVVRPGLRLAIDPRSREPFEWFCFRSLEMCREFDAFCREMAASRCFLDAGACHGIFSLAFAHGRPDVLALAIEPSPIAHEILIGNVGRNGLANVIPRQIAAGSAAGRLRMRQVWHHLEAMAEGEVGEGTVEVPVRTLDDLCEELAFEPDLMKIDVEGYELAALQGARGILTQYRPRLLLELHPTRLRELGGSLGEVVDLLEGLGYRFFDLGGAPLSGGEVAHKESNCRLLAAPAIGTDPTAAAGGAAGASAS